MTTATQRPTPARRATVFHTLTVSAVERLCDDAVAVTFAVPDELRERFRCPSPPRRCLTPTPTSPCSTATGAPDR